MSPKYKVIIAPLPHAMLANILLVPPILPLCRPPKGS